jgi:DNA mismatch repair protein MutS2
MYAKIKGQTSVGQITKLEGNNALLTVGMMQLNIKTDRLTPVPKPEKEETQQNYSYIGKLTRAEIDEKKLNFKSEIDVRGMNGEETLAAVTYFIDDAILLSVSRVRILHGTGTGYLRSVIRQYLHTVPEVTDYRDEHVQFGGAGITVVTLK